MAVEDRAQMAMVGDDDKVAAHERPFAPQHDPQRSWHCRDLFLKFRAFRESGDYKELINFLTLHYPAHVKNKTFNFFNTQHLFHSLYAYIPAATSVGKERKQIRLSEECIHKLFTNTKNDFNLYVELYEMLEKDYCDDPSQQECPCQLLLQRRDEINSYVNSINQKTFDSKPPKLKKELIDNVMYKYSLNWKALMLKRKTNETSSTKKKRKVKKRTILTDERICLKVDNFAPTQRLQDINGMTLNACRHEFVVTEKQTRAGDEAVSFIHFCRLCGQLKKKQY
uniref:Late expression factor 5 n=1 Tax=Lymantria dispar multicapsid nuclear polyhedrosis virus TaxID=10449 RepID=A0A1B1MR39_NPVLD|nr:late expression factor 5 [Lymantria dispar multiple nucleopolyhedrovirus]